MRELVREADSRVDVGRQDTSRSPDLCAAFAVLALVIARVGVYGTFANNVACRTGEIGIRMAPGAQRSRRRSAPLGLK